MLPVSRLGVISRFAGPFRVESGNAFRRIFSDKAESACISPSTSRLGARSEIRRRASAILRDEAEERLPKFECDSRRSEEHTSELQSLMRISYAVFCLKKKTKYISNKPH